MITINLIPSKQKAELRLFSFYIVLKKTILLILFSIIVIAIVLLATKIILQDYFTTMISESSQSISISKLTSPKIKEFKNELIKIGEIQKNYYAWTKFFIKFNDLVDNGITIEQLMISRDGELKIACAAKKRDDLLNFKNNLDKSEMFTNKFEIPLEVLLDKENIKFSFNLKVDLDKIQ